MDKIDAGVSFNTFDGEAYLDENPDVAATGMDPWRHFISHGVAEGRTFSPRKSPQAIGSDAQAVLDIFAGEWNSQMPSSHGLKAIPGTTTLFEDPRIGWLYQKFGPMTGMDILELGPLEAAHTYMLHNLGARSITSIENNPRAYLKCLAIKEIFHLKRANFVLDDAIRHLNSSDKKYDIAVASGILYHMTNPIALLDALSSKSDRLFFWTQYFDQSIIAKRPDSSIYQPASEIAPGYFGSKRAYPREVMDLAIFSGGDAPYAIWMTRESIIGYLRSKGFQAIDIAFDDPYHVNGPAFALCARRNPAA